MACHVLHLQAVKQRLAMMRSEVPSWQHLWLLGFTEQCPASRPKRLFL